MRTLTRLLEKKPEAALCLAAPTPLGKIKVIIHCFLLFTMLSNIFLVSKVSMFATKTLNKTSITSFWSLSERFSIPNCYFTYLQQVKRPPYLVFYPIQIRAEKDLRAPLFIYFKTYLRK